jgi:outer membrane protein TolC
LLEASDRQRLAEREGVVAARALAAARSQQQMGVATKLDVLDEELAALQAEQRATEALYDRSLAETRLARAMGEDPPEARLDDAPSGWKAP